MKGFLSIFLILAFTITMNAQDKKYPEQAPMRPAMSEYWTPQPPVVTPGNHGVNAIPAPSDAIVLFDGTDLSKWENTKGEAAGWTLHDGVFTVKKGTGDIQTKQKFNDFHLHIEWCVPEGITGESQARGNSGVFLQGMYEIQILDCYENETYVNGQTGSVYKQTPPLANAMNPPGEWNVYDIIYTAPTFKKDGTYRTNPRVTVLQNGVLLQNNTIILGTTEYIGFPKVVEHGAGPIKLQDHGDPSAPISFRNIWIREL
ncbi:MAG TPA: DUF1080 domain-containing protein [Porphyromonadaceae bacterium]|jgi:hypothetical protein|nr:DUF1080 domain-containing protein [Bacteroidales bacterium]HBT86005.1 DUF1080 domain-containing protein [Porphyromonadaceae bacterium]